MASTEGSARIARRRHAKVDGLAHHVDLFDHDAQRIAKAKLLAPALADQAMALGIDAVVVVAELAKAHQTLAGGFGNLYKHAPVGDARNDSVKLLAQELLHVHSLHVLDRRAFGVGGVLLALRTVLAELLERVGLGRRLAVERILQEAVHHHVGVAANRRRKVGVVVECESVVPHVLGAVHRLGHGTHGKRFKHVGLGRALDLAQQVVDRAAHVAGAVDLHLVAQRTHKLTQ